LKPATEAKQVNVNPATIKLHHMTRRYQFCKNSILHQW